MAVRAKFVCTGKNPVELNGKPAWNVGLTAVWAGSKEGQAASENAIFGEYTPSGSVAMTIANPAAAEQFTPGQEYYLDFTPAVPPPAPTAPDTVAEKAPS